jgi:hypothetical protein
MDPGKISAFAFRISHWEPASTSPASDPTPLRPEPHAEYLSKGEWSPRHEVTYSEDPTAKVTFK